LDCPVVGVTVSEGLRDVGEFKTLEVALRKSTASVGTKVEVIANVATALGVQAQAAVKGAVTVVAID
jgi:hypothetical protein